MINAKTPNEVRGFYYLCINQNIKTMSKLNNPTEIWKPVKGYEGRYEISNTGKLKSLNYSNSGKQKIMKEIVNNHGYRRVSLFGEGGYLQYQVHRLVAFNFIPNQENKCCINHIDGNKLNNSILNLEWVTIQENIKHAVKNDLHLYGENHGASILTKLQVLAIRKEYLKGLIGTRPLAKKYNVSRGCVQGILSGKNWKHL